MSDDGIKLPDDSLARQEAQRHIDRKSDGSGQYRKGQSGNPLGRRPGINAMAARWRESLNNPVCDVHYDFAARSLGREPENLKAELAEVNIDTVGDLLCEVNLLRALKGSIDHFREMGDRIEPKPRRVDVTVQPGAGAAALAGLADDEESAAGDSYYDELNRGEVH